MLMNKTVYLEGGGTTLCEYDSDSLTLAPLWNIVFVISLGLNVFAIIGNLIVILACFLQKKKPPLIIYIHALAFSDLFYALLAPLYTYRYVLQNWPKLTINFGLTGRLSRSVAAFGNAFSTISCWLVVALTIDRLILTRLPFKASRLSTAKRAYISTAAIVLLSFGFNSAWMYEVLDSPITVLPCNGYYIIPEKVIKPDGSVYIPIRYHKEYQLYSIVSSILFLYAIPTIVMLVCNFLILQQFRRKVVGAETGRPAVSKMKQSEIRLTKMIVVVSVMFMICNMPDIATRLMWKFLSPKIVSHVQPIAHLFLTVNVAANFIIYSLYNRHLFATIRSMCACCQVNEVMGIDSSLDSQQRSTNSSGLPSSSQPLTDQSKP